MKLNPVFFLGNDSHGISIEDVKTYIKDMDGSEAKIMLYCLIAYIANERYYKHHSDCKYKKECKYHSLGECYMFTVNSYQYMAKDILKYEGENWR
jgi:hypothetical protein